LTKHDTGISLKELEDIKGERKKHEVKVEKSAKKMANIRKALSELKNVRLTDFRKKTQPEEAMSKETASITSPWTLSKDAISKLSESTMEVINNLGISLATTSIPQLTQLLQSESIEVGAEVYKAGKSMNVVKIGSNFFNVNSIFSGATEGFTLGAKGVGAFRNVGISDLMVVKQEIQKYEPGEVAHIENVLQGEFKKRTHRKTKRTEETYLTEIETTEESERDLQSTERFEMQKETQETIKKDSKFGLDVTVKYGGFIDVTANTKYATKKASEKARKSATNYARDITERSVSRIQVSIVG
jgi:hypothetical protein